MRKVRGRSGEGAKKEQGRGFVKGRGREKVEGRVTHNVYCFLLPIGLNQIKIIYSKKNYFFIEISI